MSRSIFKLSAGTAFFLFVAFLMASPHLAAAQNSGYGCIEPPDLTLGETAETVHCSARTDCSDLSACTARAGGGTLDCQILAQCVPEGPNPPGGGASNVPNLPINPRLPIPNAVPISGFEGEGPGQGPAGLVANMYSFAFLLAGFLAFAMIVYGGVRWTFSAGSAGAKKDAKDSITQAMLGLALLLLAYLILRTINPDLTRLQLPTLPPYVPPTLVETPPPGDGEPPGERDIVQPPTDDGVACGINIPPIAGDALSFEGGATVSFTSSDPNVQRNIDFLQLTLNSARQILNDKGNGARLTVNSAYRPLSYQQHLYQVWSKSNAFDRNPALAASCPKLKEWVDNEMRKHVLIRADGTKSTVSRPSICSPHVRGVAVDITLEGIEHEQADALFKENRGVVKLGWKAIQGDEAHYELCTRPYTPSECSNSLPRSCQ